MVQSAGLFLQRFGLLALGVGRFQFGHSFILQLSDSLFGIPAALLHSTSTSALEAFQTALHGVITDLGPVKGSNQVLFCLVRFMKMLSSQSKRRSRSCLNITASAGQG